MKCEYSVGVIGCGFVGNAVATGCRRVAKVRTYDINPSCADSSFEGTAEQDLVFVCVPTPTNAGTGACDLSILESVVKKLSFVQSEGSPVGVVIIKSTVPPQVVNDYCDRFPLLRFLSNPEFLTERTAVRDFQHPTRVIIGTSPDSTRYAYRLGDLYRAISDTKIYYVLHDGAALIKYASNCFFAVKIAYFNELDEICDKLDVSYTTVLNGVLASGWVNPMHTKVPGPDGHRGFGGKCLPKDVMALAKFARSLGVDPVMLEAALRKNHQVRPEQDYEHIEGAFS